MNTEIIHQSNGLPIDFLSKIPTELLNREIQIRLSTKVDKLETDIQELKAVYDRDKNAYVDLFKAQSESQMEQSQMIKNALNKVSYVIADPDKYKTLSDIGTDFIPNLSGYQLGVLLSKLKIAKRYKKDNAGAWETVPYQQSSVNNPLAKAVPSVVNNRQVVSYHWNVELLKKKLLQAISLTGRLNEFQSLKHSKEIWNFINSL